MNITIISYHENGLWYLNAISHKCSLEALKLDAVKTLREFQAQTKEAGKLDAFWHLGQEFDTRYGHDAWQQLPLESLIQQANKKEDLIEG